MERRRLFSDGVVTGSTGKGEVGFQLIGRDDSFVHQSAQARHLLFRSVFVLLLKLVLPNTGRHTADIIAYKMAFDPDT